MFRWRCCQVRIVFIGDSITELGKFEDPEALGTGYVRLLYDYFITAYPANDFEVINKGISGNRIDDLATRWQTDVIDVNPDIVRSEERRVGKECRCRGAAG